MQITITPLAPSDMKPFPQTLTFGKAFSNRMFTQHWTAGQGWHDAKINNKIDNVFCSKKFEEVDFSSFIL